jgi:DNA repair protein RecO (recombination protein O)
VARSLIAFRTHETDALVVHRTAIGESDFIVSLMTESLGRVSALARGARKSQKRFGGALEPLHTLRVKLDEQAGRELLQLRECQIACARRELLSGLKRLQSGLTALSWLHKVAPERTREPAAYLSVLNLLDALNSQGDDTRAEANLAEFGLHLLTAIGFGFQLERCVRCDASCPEGRAALVDASKGGLVCRSCGGASLKLEAPTRQRFILACRGALGVLQDEDLGPAMSLVKRGLSSHAGLG